MADSDIRFLGRGWGFPPAFDPRTRGALMVTQVEDVEESLGILFSTNPGERVMQPGYGCGLQRMVFENLNESMLTELRSLIEKAVLFFEVRIHLDYTIRTTNTRHNMVYPLYLEEGRGARELKP